MGKGKETKIGEGENLSAREIERLLSQDGVPKTFTKKHRGKHRQQGSENWREPHAVPEHVSIVIRRNDSRFPRLSKKR